jgi:hypothetical protein
MTVDIGHEDQRRRIFVGQIDREIENEWSLPRTQATPVAIAIGIVRGLPAMKKRRLSKP